MSKITSVLWTSVVGVSALAFMGCAPMSVGAPVVTDVPRGSEERARPNGATDAAITRDGMAIEVQLSDHCDVQRFDRFERTTIREHHNDAPQNDWYAGIGGALIGGAGALAVAEPSRMTPSDGSRSATEVRGGGFALIGLGAALLAVPVIDYVRAHREAEHKVERVEEPGPLVRRDTRCGPPPGGTEVLARYPGSRTLSLGRTDARGTIRADLDALTPPDLLFRRDATVALDGPSGTLGELPLADVYDHRDAAAWRAAEATECSTSVEEQACVAHVTYVARYPDGTHAGQARVAIEAARQRRRAFADEAAWALLDGGACRVPAKNDVAVIETACSPVQQYLAEYPDGLHADAAREILKPSRVVLARLEEAQARRDREEAASPATGAFIAYAGNGGGPTLCSDGSLSHSSGRGTCSHHGGIAGGGSSRATGGSRGGGSRSSGGRGRRK